MRCIVEQQLAPLSPKSHELFGGPITLALAFAKQVAKNDARIIRRQLAPLFPQTHELCGSLVTLAQG